MLTVLVIIGLMSSAVILTFPDKKSGVEVQAQNLLRTVNAVSEEALISGQSTAFGVSREAYAFYVFDQDEWQVRDEIKWDADARPEFTLSDTRFELPEKLAPLIVFEPIGLSEPFTLTVSDVSKGGKNLDYIFVSDGNGSIRMAGKS